METEAMMHRQFTGTTAYDRPFRAEVVDGEVVVMGVCASEALTPEAALVSAERLRQAAQQAMKDRAAGPTRAQNEG